MAQGQDKQDAAKGFDESWEEANAQPGAQTDEQAPAAPEGEDAGAPGLAIVIGAAPEEGEPASAEAGGDKGKSEAPAAPEGAPAGESPEEAQRRKSWEGRLKKREEALSAKESELAAAKAALPAPASGDVAAVVASLNEDFGEDFVSRLRTIIKADASTAADAVAGKIHGEVEGLAQSIQAALQGMHESAILDVHPDLDDVVSSDAFKQWLSGKDEDKRSSAEAVLQHGMWPQVIRLVQTYKDETKSQAPAEPAAEEERDPFDDAPPAPPASVAVRLPDKPADASDFDAAWDEPEKK